MIEYLLMLLLTVAIIAGINRAMGDPLKNFARNYVGDMVRCIIETGELPQRALEICGITITINLEEFTIEQNSPSPGSGVTGGSGGSDAKDSESDDNERDTASSSRSRSSRRPRSSAINSRPRSGSSSIDGLSSPQTGKKTVTSGNFEVSGEDSAFEGSEAGENKIRIIRRKRAEGVGGAFSLGGGKAAKEEEDLKPAPLNVKRSVEARADLDDLEPQGPQAFKVEDTKTRGPAAARNDEGIDFSFGNLLKWGIIIAILVIFCVFMLNQLNSIRKGWTS